MYLMQVDAFGPDDRRCTITSEKITMVQETGTLASSPHSEDKDSTVTGEEEDKDGTRTKPGLVMKMFKKMSKKK